MQRLIYPESLLVSGKPIQDANLVSLALESTFSNDRWCGKGGMNQTMKGPANQAFLIGR